MAVEDALRTGPDYLRWKIDLARVAIGQGQIVTADDALLEALDIVTGHCAPHLKIRSAPPPIGWFAVKDSTGATVVEFVPDRRTPCIAVAWSDTYEMARTLALLLADNEQHPNPRIEITGGERATEDEQ